VAVGWCGLDYSGSGYEHVVGCYEYGNEPSGSIIFFIIYLKAITKYFLLANVLVFLQYLGGAQRPHPS
jgi:hypothetical protein